MVVDLSTTTKKSKNLHTLLDKLNKGQITLLDLFVPIILYFFTSDNADETFKFGIFQYHCSVFIAPDRALYPFCLYVFSPVTQS